jgi:hypothetical protein
MAEEVLHLSQLYHLPLIELLLLLFQQLLQLQHLRQFKGIYTVFFPIHLKVFYFQLLLF